MYFFLKEPKSRNETPIYIIHFVVVEKKNFKFSTGQKIKPDDWDFENRMPKTKRGAAGVKLRNITTILRQYSDLLEEQIENADLNNTPLTSKGLRDAFNNKFRKKSEPQKLTFPETIQLFIVAKNKSGAQSPSWNQKYGNLKKKIEHFEEYTGKPIKFSDIDSDWIDEYSGFLRQINVEKFKPHNDNTLYRNINFLFTFLKWARGKHHTLDLDQIKNPVRKYQADDVHLTEDEVKAIEELELPRESLERARDLFLIGIYSGQRFSDYSVFEKADVVGDLLIKRAEKTENESFIPLHPRLKNLLEKYDWKLPRISGQNFNPHIQEICKLAGINEEFKETIYRGNKKEVLYKPKYEMVGSHTARRTFITLAAEKGMPDHIIMKITGIRDPKTLQKYKKTSQRSVIEQMEKMW